MTKRLTPRQRLHPLLIAMAASLSLGIFGCTEDFSTSNSPGNEVQSQADSPSTGEIQVVTTFLPITQFTKAVAGDRAAVNQLIPASTSVHDYQAKPGEVQMLTQADVLVQNGLEMEGFLEDMIENSENADLVVIDSSEGIATISSEELEAQQTAVLEDDDHDHDHEHHDEEKAEKEGVESEHDHEDHGDKDVAKEGHHDHDHGEFDPHIWLDPKRAIQQVENIRDGLIAADPGGEEVYRANAAAYITELETLDAEITAELEPYAGKTFVAYHAFAPYFAQSYGLKAEYLVDVPEESPSPEDVEKVINIVKESNLKTLLTEPQAGQGFEALANDLQVNISAFDPIETGDKEALTPDSYLQIMRDNVDNLQSAFSGSTQSFRFPSQTQFSNLPNWSTGKGLQLGFTLTFVFHQG